MAIQRYYTVRDRALRAIKTTLEGITYANGYNTNVRKVEYGRTIPTEHHSPPQIYLMPDASIVSWRSTHHKWESVPIELWFVSQAENDMDTEYNLFLGDIQRALSCGNIVDPTYPITDKAQIYVTEGASSPLYNQFNSGVMVGVVRYSFEFWRHHSDSRLWDDEDILVPVVY